MVNENFKNFILSLKMELPVGTSFPSGHAFSSFLCATILTIFYKKFGVVLFILATLIAFSRVYLCVHYPTDILVGSILGVLFAILCFYVYKLILNKFEKKKRDCVRNEKV